MCVGYLGTKLEEYVGDGSTRGMRIRYSYDGERQRGTAGAIRQALPLLGDEFLAIYGDSYLDCDYSTVWHAFEQSGRAGLMTVFENDGSLVPSNVRYEDHRIIAYDKIAPTSGMRHVDYGLSAFRRAAFDDVSNDNAIDLATVFRRLLGAGQLAAFEVPFRFYEVGTAEGIADTEALLAGWRA